MIPEQKLAEITLLKKELEKTFTQKDWDQSFLERVKVDFTFVSNKLEGSTLTYGQTLQMIKEFTTPANTSIGEVVDVVNHQAVLDIIFKEYRSTEITEDRIKQLHSILMKDISQWADDGYYSPGNYKTFDNYAVRSNGRVHGYLEPSKVPAAMTELVNKINEKVGAINDNAKETHTLTIATWFHQEFLDKIHPFADGNGRIGRIFMNLILLKSGYPPIFITDIDRQSYLNRFELEGSDVMLDFMCDRMLDSLEVKRNFIHHIL